MAFSKGSMSLVILALSGSPAQGARIAVHEGSEDTTQWGRSCAYLETRFQNQQIRLAESDGTTALVRSVGLMRTLRRARNCEWVTSGDVDISAASQMAANYFHQSPCYEPSMAAYTAAQNLPEEEQENAMQDAVAILLSDQEGCAPPTAAAPELNESEEELEEEIDNETDEILEELATASPESSLIQQENPILIGAFSWGLAGLASWPVIIASILVGILMGLFCNTLIHLIIRIFRWLRCRMFGHTQSCTEYSPASWVRGLVGAGCGFTGLLFGPFGVLFAEAAVGGGAMTAAVGGLGFGR